MARKLPTADAGLSQLAENLNDLGKIVRNARAHGQLRIDDAAALLGVSSDLLSRLENGKPVTTDRLFKTLDGFGLQILVLPKAIAKRLAKASGSVEPLP